MSTTPLDPQESSWVLVESPPELIFDSASQSLITPANKRYPEVYLMLQDQHVSQQREFYNKHKDSLHQFYTWRELDISRYLQIYLLVLMERFEKDLMPSWAITWLDSFKIWYNQRFYNCTICGILPMGDMCGGTNNKNPIYLIFD